MLSVWHYYWIVAGLFAIFEIALVLWAGRQGQGQAMPPMIIPLVLGTIGLGLFALIAAVIALVNYGIHR